MKHTFCTLFSLALAAGLVNATGSSTIAAASKPAGNIGPVKFHYGRMFATGVGNKSSHVSLTDGFTLTSTSGQYEVTGVSADISGSPGSIQNITARGSSTEQVTVKFYNQAEGTEVTFLSDKAVMEPMPIPGQLRRQKVTFTGNVSMKVSNPAALATPSESTMDKAVVYIGSGPDYPQIEADNVNGTAVPASAH